MVKTENGTMFRLHVNYLYISSLVTGLKDSAVYSSCLGQVHGNFFSGQVIRQVCGLSN